MAWLGLLAVLPMTVHFAVLYGGFKPPRGLLGVPYGLAAVFAVLDLRGMLSGPGTARASGLLDGMADPAQRCSRR